MAVMDDPCPFGFSPRVEAEDYFYCLAPVGALLRRVEEPDIVRKVAFVIGCKMGLVWGTVLEWSFGHRKRSAVHSLHCEIKMNRINGRGRSINRCTGCIVLVVASYRQKVPATPAGDSSATPVDLNSTIRDESEGSFLER